MNSSTKMGSRSLWNTNPAGSSAVNSLGPTTTSTAFAPTATTSFTPRASSSLTSESTSARTMSWLTGNTNLLRAWSLDRTEQGCLHSPASRARRAALTTATRWRGRRPPPGPWPRAPPRPRCCPSPSPTGRWGISPRCPCHSLCRPAQATRRTSPWPSHRASLTTCGSSTCSGSRRVRAAASRSARWRTLSTSTARTRAARQCSGTRRGSGSTGGVTPSRTPSPTRSSPRSTPRSPAQKRRVPRPVPTRARRSTITANGWVAAYLSAILSHACPVFSHYTLHKLGPVSQSISFSLNNGLEIFRAIIKFCAQSEQVGNSGTAGIVSLLGRGLKLSKHFLHCAEPAGD